MAEKIPASVDEAFPTCVNFWAHVVPAISRLYIGSRREIHRARGFEARDTTDREGLGYFGCGSAACPAVTLMAIFDAADV
jgi:hypothetical protein